MTAPSSSVSVVINTLNRAALLNDAIRGAVGLDHADLEVVVVNGPSTDDTAAVLAKWAGRIKVGQCPEANLSRSRNIGLELAAGEFIFFMDDDAVPHTRWVRSLLQAFRDPSVGAAGGYTLDNTGVRWQVRKTVCDRFGSAFEVSDSFDERTLCRPGSPYYPSLLGTNSAFRSAALRAIGGFDHTFAYLLDETDVCLRLIDAGWKVLYEPRALVFHQFAASHIRSTGRVARTLYPSALSKGYFAMRHGAAQSISQAGAALDDYRQELLTSNAWQEKQGHIEAEHRFSLDQDLLSGLEAGIAAARTRPAGNRGDSTGQAPPAFLPLPRREPLRIALVSRDFPPAGHGGIARWTFLVAEGLAARGHEVHVLTAAGPQIQESVSFQDGLWLHLLKPEGTEAGPTTEAYDLPPHAAAWSARVAREARALKGFGVNLVSFPIWDLEGLPLLEDPELACVVSLHTTWAMARPFKPEWSLRPLYGHYVADRMIAAEKRLLARAPVLLANSEAVITATNVLYELDVAARCRTVAHGTPDPRSAHPGRAEAREAKMRAGAPLRVLFVGRFEPRKGFEIAARVAARILAELPSAEVWFAGDVLSNEHRRELSELGLGAILEAPQVRFLGAVEREALDGLYLDCDLTLAPSRFESFGLIAIEAFAAGRPVLALAAGGLGEVVRDGVTGRTFETEGQDDAALALQMAQQIVAFDTDREALLTMAVQARKAWQDDFTVETMISRLEAVYREVLAEQHEQVRS